MTKNCTCSENETHPSQPPEAVRPVLAVSDEQTVAGMTRRSSFTEHRNEVLERIGFPTYYAAGDHAAVVELASIITEVELLDGGYPISICGEQLPAWLVADVFRELRTDHIHEVLGNLDQLAQVTRRRQYLRSMLYNAAMEMDITSLALRRAFTKPKTTD